MSNTFLEVTLPAAMERMAARINARCVLVKNSYLNYTEDFKTYGDRIQTELPNYFNATAFNGSISASPYKRKTVDVVMNNLPDVSFEITSKEKTLNLTSFEKQVMEPATTALLAFVEREGYKQIYKEIYNTTGTPGTPPSTYASLINTKTFISKFDEAAVQKNFMIDPLAYASLISNQASGLGMLNILNEKVSSELLDGYLGEKGGMSFYESNFVPIHTAGNINTGQTIQVDANVAEDSNTISLKGLTATTGGLKAGDVFTIAGIYSMNPYTRLNTGMLQRFVVQEDASANSSGVVTVTVEPRIVSPASTSIHSQYISVSSLPIQNAVVTVLTAGAANGQISHQNLLIANNAVALVTRPLALPEGGVKSYTTTFSEQTPIRFRVTMGYDMQTKKEIMSFDCLFGFKVISPWFCARLLG